MEQNNIEFKNLKVTNGAELEEYFEDTEKAYSILKDLTFDIKYIGTEIGKGYKYITTIYKNGKKADFEYFEGSAFDLLDLKNALDKILNCVCCIVTDFVLVEELDLLDFIDEFEYNNNLREGQRIYNLILENNKKLLEILDKTEIEEIVSLKR